MGPDRSFSPRYIGRDSPLADVSATEVTPAAHSAGRRSGLLRLGSCRVVVECPSKPKQPISRIRQPVSLCTTPLLPMYRSPITLFCRGIRYHPRSTLSKFCMAHWHKGAILIWGALRAPSNLSPLQLISHPKVVRWSPVLTISRLSRWSINYYNDTARQASQAGLDRQRANGGLGEYYSEGDTRAPTWLIAGDAARTETLVGLDGRAAEGGAADPDMVRRWLDDGIAPNGAPGRAFTKGSVHGFDLTFAAPKSVSLLRALTHDIAEKAMQAAHQRAITAAMTYLNQHAGYTRVHNPHNGSKDLQRLPGLAAIAYQHETSRCGDLHLHTHGSCPTRRPARTARWSRLTPSRCITKPKPPASCTPPAMVCHPGSSTAPTSRAANSSLIRGSACAVSAARWAATDSAVAPRLVVMSQLWGVRGCSRMFPPLGSPSRPN